MRDCCSDLRSRSSASAPRRCAGEGGALCYRGCRVLRTGRWRGSLSGWRARGVGPWLWSVVQEDWKARGCRCSSAGGGCLRLVVTACLLSR